MMQAAVILTTLTIYRTSIDEKLYNAVNNGDIAVCEKFIRQGGDPTRILPGKTGNAIARLYLKRATIEQERDFAYQCLELFLNNDVAISGILASESGWMLHRLSARCLYQSVKVLLDHGANPDKAVTEGYTPLYAVLNEHLHHLRIATYNTKYYKKLWPHTVKTCEVLLEGGADPSILTPNGARLISIPVYHGNAELVRMFLDHGADVNARRAIPDPQWYAKLYDYTPLHTVALEPGPNKAEIAELLLKRGADRTLKDALGRTALDIARQKNNTAVAEVLERN